MSGEPHLGSKLAPEQQPEERAVPRCIPSEDLLQGSRDVLIGHGQELYRLRLTRNDKLILGK